MEAKVDSGLLWRQGTDDNSTGVSPFEGSCHYCRFPYHSLTSGQTTGREHSAPHQYKIGLKIY